MDTYRVIGLMSGTSLDGLDLAFCELTYNEGKWQADIIIGKTINYPPYWLDKLKTAHEKSGEELAQLHTDYGQYLGLAVKDFMLKYQLIDIDLVASHGHTIFHQPDTGLTFQLGHGASIARHSGITTVNDFRTTDVALGGQGAPLVPIGDELLFSDYTYCLNLGGFANISYKDNSKRLAYDICPVNIVLNALAATEGMDYDEGGALARSGNIDTALLEKLEQIPFFKQAPPKSLGREWLEKEYLPLVDDSEALTADKLRTVCENIANQISTSARGNGKMLITGGGAFNTFLVDLIRSKTDVECIVPDDKLVNYKEALVFAFLGVLRMRGEVNCLSSVTGAIRDSVGGSVWVV